MSKLNDAVKNKVVKKNFYDKLADDIQNNDTIDFIKNAELKDAKVVVIEKKITNYDNLITTIEFNKLTTEHFVARLKQSRFAVDHGL